MGKGRAPTSSEYYKIKQSKNTYEKFRDNYTKILTKEASKGDNFAISELSRLKDLGKI